MGLTISASTLKTFTACPLQMKRAKIERLPQQSNAKAVFGTIIHRCIEEYNQTGNIDLAKDHFKDLWTNPEQIGLKPEVWPKMTSFGSLKQRGVEILDSYHDMVKWTPREILCSEHKFLVPFGNHQLKGVVDHVELVKNGKGNLIMRVVDFKTNSALPNRAELALDMQFTCYHWASLQKEFWVGNGPDYPGLPNGEMLYELYKDVPRRAIWWHLWNPREIDAGPRVKEDFERLNRLLDEIEKSIQHDIFPPRIGEACGWCSYQKECGLTIPTREEQLDDPNVWV